MSWWDYGYQITAMANRTILVDNNTWNNTHISRVGQVSWLKLWNNDVSVRAVLQMLTVLSAVLQAMASTEERAYEIMRELDVSYVLVIFGGLTGYSSDGKSHLSIDRSRKIPCLFSTLWPFLAFVWRPSLWTADINKFLWMVRIGGSTDTGKHIKEHDYYTPTGEFRVDREGSPVLLNCLMYKMCYYRFGQVYTEASE